MQEIDIFTDGGCAPNPGPGAWAALLRYGTHQKEMSGFEENTTNNRMELMAAIQALQALMHPCQVRLYTDSQYVKQGITVWIQTWKKNGWHTASKTPIKNKDLWETLDRLCHIHHIHWEWVKGHSGHIENDYVDQLVQKRRMQAR